MFVPAGRSQSVVPAGKSPSATSGEYAGVYAGKKGWCFDVVVSASRNAVVSGVLTFVSVVGKPGIYDAGCSCWRKW